jgi:primosomal replication protein N
VNENHIGKIVEIDGQFRSHNQSDDKDRKLKLYVFVRQIEEMDSDTTHKNYIELDGFICKEPVYRTTPLGRNITDCIVACNRPYGKSDYIPCIFWGRTATFISKFNTGKHIKIYGRIQSREYIKKISDEESETRIAYEVSTDKLEVFDAEEE